jgi:ABC-type transport system involved in multi-copper enzyme maturation permease subunit
MSETVTSPAAPPSPDAPVRAPRVPATWGLTGRGILTVMTLELRQRVRSTRWIVVLAVWALVLGGLAALIHHAIFSDGLSNLDDAQRNSRAGAMMFGFVVLLVLVMGSLVAPALSATSVNGDRSAGVLATLQTTLLTPAEIAIGKLLAAWATALALLVVASPFILWAYVSGGTPAARLVVVLLLLAVMLLVVCAIGLGWSAIAARTASSAVLTYLSVAFMGLGLPLLTGLLMPVVTTTETITVRTMVPVDEGQSGSDPAMRCAEQEQTQGVTHYERIWWLLAANPFVVIADASPKPSTQTGTDSGGDVLSAVRSGVRELRLGPETTPDYCYNQDAGSEARNRQRAEDRENLGITWPYGLAADLAIAAGFTVVAVRRLRAPTRKLPRGTRVA